MLKKVEVKQTVGGDMLYTQNSKADNPLTHNEKVKMSFDLPATVKTGPHTYKPSTIDEDATILSSKENTLPPRTDSNEDCSLSNRGQSILIHEEQYYALKP